MLTSFSYSAVDSMEWSLHIANNRARAKVCGNGNDAAVCLLQTKPMSKNRKTVCDPMEANFLSKWREFRKLTGEQLAEKVGTNKSVISLLESGGRKLSPKWARRLAPALGAQPGWLLDVDPYKVNTDVLEIWADIPPEMRRHSLEILRTFARKKP